MFKAGHFWVILVTWIVSLTLKWISWAKPQFRDMEIIDWIWCTGMHWNASSLIVHYKLKFFPEKPCLLYKNWYFWKWDISHFRMKRDFFLVLITFTNGKIVQIICFFLLKWEKSCRNICTREFYCCKSSFQNFPV